MVLALVQQTYREILLSNDNRIAIVDACDYEGLMQFDWQLFERKGRRPKVARRDNEGGIHFMHHEILRLRGIDFQRVQHVNGDTLDNRFTNFLLTGVKLTPPEQRRQQKQLEEFKQLDLNVGRLLDRFEKVIPLKIRYEINLLKSQRLKAAFMLGEVIDNVESYNETQIKQQLERILETLRP